MRRATLALALSLLVLAPAVKSARADTRSDVYQAFQRCNTIDDQRAWLNCIYGAVQPIRAELNLPPAPQAQIKTVPQTAAVTYAQPRREGVLSYVLGGRKQVEDMPVREYVFDTNRRFIITLANGQVWRQAGNDDHLAAWQASPASYIATIKSGSLGSSILQLRGESGAFLVQRVR